MNSKNTKTVVISLLVVLAILVSGDIFVRLNPHPEQDSKVEQSLKDSINALNTKNITLDTANKALSTKADSLTEVKKK